MGLCRFLVTEGRERVGGNITSMSGNGYLWEEGPSSFQPNDAMLKAAVSPISTHGILDNVAFMPSEHLFWGHKQYHCFGHHQKLALRRPCSAAAEVFANAPCRAFALQM